MYDNFTAQLAGLDLAGFSIQPAPFNEIDFPAEEASEQTLAAVWSDLFALFVDTALEADAEDIAWGFVNLFHRAASRKSAQVDRASDEIRALLASADGSEVHSSNLEEQVERAQAAEASMLAFEHMREVAAMLYREEIGASWKPMSGSRVTHGKNLTSAVIDARDFLKARSERRRAALTPEGTSVVFAGGRATFATTEQAKRHADSLRSAATRDAAHPVEGSAAPGRAWTIDNLSLDGGREVSQARATRRLCGCLAGRRHRDVDQGKAGGIRPRLGNVALRSIPASHGPRDAAAICR